ncbi:MAG: hypothetical protein P8L49_09370 [Opitutaceae bacterium]|nr:hypothetical protein [Opitutaceae bacterium]
MIADWTGQTGDTILTNSSPHRHTSPRIENGKIIPAGDYTSRIPHGEMPGATRNAMEINDPDSLSLK